MSKVCIISARFYPQAVGSGTAAYSLTLELARRGHEVTVLTDRAVKSLNEGLEYPFHIVYIDGFEDYTMGRASMKKPSEAIFTQITNLRPDVVHVCNFMPMLLITSGRSLISCPVVFSPYNTPLKDIRSIGYYTDHELDLALARFILSSGGYDKLIAGSQAYLDAAHALGADRTKTELSYLGVSIDDFIKESTVTIANALKEYIGDQVKSGEAYMILPSRITKQKGIIEAVKALAIIKDSTYLKLILTGMYKPFDVNYANEVMKLARTLGVEKNIVKPTKFIPRNILPVFLKGAQLVIVPSHYEGLGLSAIEAQLCRTPLIVSNTYGLDEVVKDNHNGLTFTPEDYQQLAEAILRIIDDKPLSDRLVDEAAITAKRFDIRRHVDHIENIYNASMEIS